MTCPRWLLLPFITLLAGVFLMGCASVVVSGKLSRPELGFEVTVPEDWQGAIRGDEGLVITRDGMLLQQIRIERVAIDKELMFTKRRFDTTMPPHEVADVELDELRSVPGVVSFALEENLATTVAGRRGFRLVYTWRTTEGLRLKRVHCGLLEGKWVYRLIYQAAARYYFDRDLATFEHMRASFRLLPGPT